MLYEHWLIRVGKFMVMFVVTTMLDGGKLDFFLLLYYPRLCYGQGFYSYKPVFPFFFQRSLHTKWAALFKLFGLKDK